MTSQQSMTLCKLAYGDWPHVELTEDTFTSWALTLADCDYERTRNELLALMRKPHQWPVKASELRGAMEAKQPIKALPAPAIPYGSGLETYYVNGRPYVRAKREPKRKVKQDWDRF